MPAGVWGGSPCPVSYTHLKALLLEKMRAGNISAAGLAQWLGISASAFSRRINGKQSFTAEEADLVCKRLAIAADEDKIAIFLS